MIPGFVDSHTHLVFGGDRAEEFAARMAGRRYEAGGIRSTVAATRAATDDELRARLAGFVAELHAQGTTTFEVKSGYGLSVADEERLVRLAREVTDEVTFLGAHVCRRVPRGPEFADDPDRAADAYVDLVVGEMLDACAPHSRWVDVFCERGAFTPEQSRRVLEAGAAAGLGVRVHGNQLGEGGGVRLAVELGAASVDHCTYLSDADVAALAASDTVATLLPGRRVLDPPALPRRAPAHRRRRHGGARERLQPRVELHELDAVLHRRRGARHGHDARPRPCGRRPRAARWRCGARMSGRSAPAPRADLVLLDAPSHVHLAYRPGVPLVARTWKDGSAVG